jgi:formate hydrogenlyase subunit 6/NADH:ubiquinone oxidoreductase subunit I
MTRLALRNLFTPPATRHYPYKTRPAFKESRGRIVIDFPACIFCAACSKHCPADAIVVDKATKHWGIDRFACVSCAACVRACPKKCLAMDPARPKSADGGQAEAYREDHRGELAPAPLSAPAPLAAPAAPAAPAPQTDA